MYEILKNYSAIYPMAPLGGLFVALIGLSVILGSPLSRLRLALVYGGFALGTLALIFGGKFANGLPMPTTFQITSLVIAIIVEIAAFAVVMPRIRPRGERLVLIATLAIVGTHFLIMLPAFGPLIGLLGCTCILNAALAWRMNDFSASAFWFVDGLLKLSAGIALMLTSPLLYSIL